MDYKGILETSTEIKAWLLEKSPNRKEDFQTIAMLMERAGTGGSLFRNLYRDFLAESAEFLDSAELRSPAKGYANIAELWREVADLFHQAGETGRSAFGDQAAAILVELSAREKGAVERVLAEFVDAER